MYLCPGRALQTGQLWFRHVHRSNPASAHSRGSGGRMALLPEAWNAAILALGRASRTKADWNGRWLDCLGALKAELERVAALLESIRLPGAEALQACRSSVGRTMDAIVGERLQAWTELVRLQSCCRLLRSVHVTRAVSEVTSASVTEKGCALIGAERCSPGRSHKHQRLALIS